MVGADEAEQRRLAGAVRAEHRPAFAGPHRPRHIAQHDAFPVTDVDVAHLDNLALRIADCGWTESRNVLSLVRRSVFGLQCATREPRSAIEGPGPAHGETVQGEDVR